MKTININNDIYCAKQKDPDADTPVCAHTRIGRLALEKQINPVRCLLSNGVDQMVHKLYDLTRDEIAIVEGKK